MLLSTNNALKIYTGQLLFLCVLAGISFPDRSKPRSVTRLNSTALKVDNGKRPNSYFTRLMSSGYSDRRASRENAKFIGAPNQETQRTFHHKKKGGTRRRYRIRDPYRSPCRRSARNHDPKPSGRFFWDLNIYNVETAPHSYDTSHDCDPAYDEYDPPQYYYEETVQPARPFYNFLYSVFGPGGTHNPQVQQAYYDMQADIQNDEGGGPQTQPPLRPGDIIGGVSNTVNDVIRVILGMRPG